MSINPETRRNLEGFRNRLDLLAVSQLREVCADLRNQLDQMQIEVAYAQDEADFWNRSAVDLQSALSDDEYATHRCIGINKSGEMMVVSTGDAHE